MLEQAVKDVWIRSEYVRDDLLLLSVDQQDEQFTEVSGEDRVEWGLFCSNELEKTI